MNRTLSTRAYLISGLVAGSLAMAGCGHVSPGGSALGGSRATETTGNHRNGAALLVTPRILTGGLKTQAIVAPLTAVDVDHVILSLFTLSGGFETAVTGPDGQALEANVPASQLADPVEFSELPPDTVFRIRAAAYSAPATSTADKISDDGGSYVDVHVGNDDRPVLSSIPCQLNDVWFDGVASGTIDIIPGAVRYRGSPAIGAVSPSPSPTTPPSPTGTPSPTPSASPIPSPAPTMSSSPVPTGSTMGMFMNLGSPDASGQRLSSFVTIDAIAGAAPASVWNLQLTVPAGSVPQYWFQWGYPASLSASPGTTSYTFGDIRSLMSWTPGLAVTVFGPTAGSSITLTLGPSAPAQSYQDDVSIQ